MSVFNKTIVRRYFQEVLHGNLDVADEIVAEVVAFIGSNYCGEVIQGREGFKGFVRYLRSAFPDMTFTVHDEVAEGSRALLPASALPLFTSVSGWTFPPPASGSTSPAPTSSGSNTTASRRSASSRTPSD